MAAHSPNLILVTERRLEVGLEQLALNALALKLATNLFKVIDGDLLATCQLVEKIKLLLINLVFETLSELLEASLCLERLTCQALMHEFGVDLDEVFVEVGRHVVQIVVLPHILHLVANLFSQIVLEVSHLQFLVKLPLHHGSETVLHSLCLVVYDIG